MSTFVLLHGAWHGGWAWQRVTPLLRAAGHQVHAPTLTGVSDRAHLLNPQVGVQVLTYRPFYIVGEIRKPGEYEYQNGMTIINAVALAGGYTHRAKASAATIERAACIGPAAPDAEVLPGDIIRIPERFF